MCPLSLTRSGFELIVGQVRGRETPLTKKKQNEKKKRNLDNRLPLAKPSNF